MKTISFNFKLLVFVIILSSCSSKKNIYYLQDTSFDEDYSIQYEEYSVKIDDILKIDINSENPDAAVAFNPKGLNFNGNAGKEALLYSGYQVDFEGNINLNIRMKQSVLLKITEPFMLTIGGTLESPKYSLH